MKSFLLSDKSPEYQANFWKMNPHLRLTRWQKFWQFFGVIV